MVTMCEIVSKLFQPLKLFQNNFRGLLQLTNIFSMFNVAEIILK